MADSQVTTAGLFQTDFAPEEFAARRGRIYDAIGKGGHALLQGAPQVRGFEAFRQGNDFYYCCGVEVAHACLLLDGGTRKAALYLPHRDRIHASEGEVLTADEPDLARQVTGLDAVYGLEQLALHLGRAKVLYTPHAPAEGATGSRDVLQWADACALSDPWDGRLSREAHLVGLVRTRYPRLEIRDLSPALDGLRLLKSAAELALLRRAGRLSALAVREAMKVTRPGLYEYQLGAVAEAIYRMHGARGIGYRAIIAAGANAWFSHYFRNNCELRAGDLVLMDFAPDCGNYTSDIGRMFPVSGRYLPWQRELYGFMVRYHRELLARIRPGVTGAEVLDEAAAEMAKVAAATCFSKPAYAEAAKRTLTFRGHLSHSVGMAVHDVGDPYAQPLRPGLVFSIDPQMWVPEEKLYIRCEDTVAVTETGIENLTAAAPLDLDEVEHLMSREHTEAPWLALA